LIFNNIAFKRIGFNIIFGGFFFEFYKNLNLMLKMIRIGSANKKIDVDNKK